MVGNLSVELRRPTARDRGLARGTAPIRSQGVLLDEVAAPPYHSVSAIVALGVFVISDHARQVPCVDEAQAGLLPEFDRAQQVFRTSVVGIFHFVIFVEGSHVPGNIGRDAGQKLRQSPQLVFGIIEAGNEQRNNLQPKAHLMQRADSLENWPNASAELVIMAVIETLQINLIQIDPWT